MQLFLFHVSVTHQIDTGNSCCLDLWVQLTTSSTLPSPRFPLNRLKFSIIIPKYAELSANVGGVVMGVANERVKTRMKIGVATGIARAAAC